MTTIPIAEAKAHLSEVLASVNATHDRVTITRNGRPIAVVVSPDDLEGLEMTLELLQDPEAVRGIRQGADEIARGEGIGKAELDELMAERRRTGR